MSYYHFSNKGYQMTCTTLVYRGVAYIKNDKGQYSRDTSMTRSSYLDENLSSKKSLASV